MDYWPTEATAVDVICELNRHNNVYFEFRNTVFHQSKFCVITHPDGTKGIDFDGQSIDEIPTF
jgi:hypothetical protein